jgi:chitinase
MEVDGAQGCLGALAKLKQENPSIRTLISVGGGSGSDEFPALAANPDARALFAQQIREFCDRHAFDGVDSG